MEFDKIIEINDRLKLMDGYERDSLDDYLIEELKYKKPNTLTIYDCDGNIIGETTNKVMSYGKVETIENMFRVYDISDKYNIQYDRPDNVTNPRWISTFGVGSGGAPLAEGNNPYIVDPNATELSTPMVFRTDTNIPTNTYWDNVKKKNFRSIYLYWDKSADDIYANLVLELDYNDCLGKTINEVGLYTCNHTLDSNGQIINKDKFSLYAKANLAAINKSPYLDKSSFRITYKVFV